MRDECARLALDIDKYIGALDGMDMTEEQKRQFLEQLWALMGEIVDIAWSEDITKHPKFKDLPDFFAEKPAK